MNEFANYDAPATQKVAAPDYHLRIESLTKQFGAFTALNDVTLDIHQGEFVCFLGPSGCGKTTLLRAIAGLDIQTHGVILQNGNDISALPAAERDFGIVFQSYALFPNMTVAKNIAYGLENQKRSRADINARVEQLLSLVGLPEQADKYPAQLSGGQQQRVALSRAIATSPALLLLDEPLSALDAKVRARLRQEIKALHRTLDVTTIMVTHDQEEALTMADRIVVMNQGVIEQVGTPNEVYDTPETAFVADFIGAMNFLQATRETAEKMRVGKSVLDCPQAATHPGKELCLALRPEDVVIEPTDDGRPNRFQATVQTHEFLGAFVRVQVRLVTAPDTALIVDIAATRARSLNLHVGDNIAIALPPERIRVYAQITNGD